MAHHAFSRTYRDPTEQLANCFALGCVVERSGCSMCVDVIDRVGREPRALESPLHRLPRSTSGRIRLREVEVIRRNTVADYFCEDCRTARARGLEIFQSENRGTFSEDHPGTMPFERATLLWRCSLQRI